MYVCMNEWMNVYNICIFISLYLICVQNLQECEIMNYLKTEQRSKKLLRHSDRGVLHLIIILGLLRHFAHVNNLDNCLD